MYINNQNLLFYQKSMKLLKHTLKKRNSFILYFCAFSFSNKRLNQQVSNKQVNSPRTIDSHHL